MDDYPGLHGLDHHTFENGKTQINDIQEYLNNNPRLKSRSTSSDSDEDGRLKRLRLSPEFNSEDLEMNMVNDPNLLGLTLNKTPSLVNFIEAQLSAESKKSTSGNPLREEARSANSSRRENLMNSGNGSRNKSNVNDCAVVSEKLKASNFPAKKLIIGTWERVSRHEGDLVTKCYYAKRKLVWEILDGPLKSKIEIQWSDIIAIKATIQQGDRLGVLEIELNQPPSFYRETNPQPRKHTLWQQTSDFTGGQAPIYRRHCVIYAPGVLDRHYQKLLNYDAKLKELSKQPFPQQLSPYFESNTPEFSNFSFNKSYGSQMFPGMCHPFRYSSSSSSALLHNHPMHNMSTMMPPMRHFSSSFPVSGGRRNNYPHQGPNNLVNVGMGNQTIGMQLPDLTTQHTNWVITTPNHQAMYQQNDSMRNTQENVVLNYIENHLLNDNQVTSSEPKLAANMDAMYSLVEHHENGTLDVTGDVYGLNVGYQAMDINYAQDVVPNNVMTYAEPVTWIVPQEANQNQILEQTMEQLASASIYGDTIHGGYPTLDINQDG